jgi:hypothetical protein
MDESLCRNPFRVAHFILCRIVMSANCPKWFLTTPSASAESSGTARNANNIAADMTRDQSSVTRRLETMAPLYCYCTHG